MEQAIIDYVESKLDGHYDQEVEIVRGLSPGVRATYLTWVVEAEVNNGGDMVGLTVRAIDPTVRYRSVTATRGKARRAEPVVALYEQDRMHHVGAFPKTEDQMTTWTEEVGDDWSPDRMDALVWAATDLLLAGPRGFAGAS